MLTSEPAPQVAASSGLGSGDADPAALQAIWESYETRVNELEAEKSAADLQMQQLRSSLDAAEKARQV